jgi:REP element-mobilizing transposase RayT
MEYTMAYNPDIHHRRSIRVKGYDYSSAGAYFITICAHSRLCLFGEIIDDEMCMNAYGTIVATAWNNLPNHYPFIQLDRYVVMPNHFHGIISFIETERNRADLKSAPTAKAPHGLSEIVRALKTFSARRINENRQTYGVPVWQRNYYEHIIRNETDYHCIAEYIDANPQRWSDDTLHPRNFVVSAQ